MPSYKSGKVRLPFCKQKTNRRHRQYESYRWRTLILACYLVSAAQCMRFSSTTYTNHVPQCHATGYSNEVVKAAAQPDSYLAVLVRDKQPKILSHSYRAQSYSDDNIPLVQILLREYLAVAKTIGTNRIIALIVRRSSSLFQSHGAIDSLAAIPKRRQGLTK